MEGRNKKENLYIKEMINRNQEHIFHFFNELNDQEKDLLFSQLENIDFNEIFNIYESFKNNKDKKNNYSMSGTDCFSIDEYKDKQGLKKIGSDLIRNGKAALLTVAGGQGSRLGYDHPKGFFRISPVKNKSLFQIFAEKIKFYSDYYKTDLKWLIMTSELNYNDISEYFKKNKFFNLKEENIYFFKQGIFPSFTLDGKFILENKNSIFTNPDGHGGIIQALEKNGIFKKLGKDKITTLHYFQVDNPLVKLLDPYFLGFHSNVKSLVTSKVIKKLYPEEKLGAIGKINNKNSVIEYSDLSKEDMYATDEKGILKYLMGSIAIHIFDVAFLSQFNNKMPVHHAIKKIKGYDFKKNPPEINEIDGIKFEKFVFDTVPLAECSTFYETERDDEFFPLKNKTGIDSIETCINGQSKMFFSWFKKAGFINIDFTDQKIEISPLYAPDYEIFLEKSKNETDKIKNMIFNKDGSLKNEIYIE